MSGITHPLTLNLVPPPQVVEHSVHSVQGVHTGQGFSLHLRDCSESPLHPEALSLGRTHCLALDCSPPPHVALQSVQSLHSVHIGVLHVEEENSQGLGNVF